MTSTASQDYYQVLGVASSATQAEIRKAYKVQALKTHPDRVPSDSPERPARTKKFQLVNDAYYTLSDSTRRATYDATRRYRPSSQSTPNAPPPNTSGRPSGGWHDEQFGDIFEEMMNEEGLHDSEPLQTGTGGRFWALLGGLSGALMGFIIFNLPGMMAGAVAGNRLGAVRDRQGKAVYEVYQGLPQSEKARLLSQLAAKVFAHVTTA